MSWVHLDRSLYQIFHYEYGWINASFTINLQPNCLYRFQLDPANPHIEDIMYFFTLEYNKAGTTIKCQELETEIEIAQAIAKAICYQNPSSTSP